MIVLLDIEDFSLRPESVQRTLHEELYRVVRFALGRAGIDLDVCPAQDRGDGLLILVPVETSPVRLLRETVRGLTDALDEHRATFADSHRMRLRLGLHHGLVITDGDRWTGTAVNDVARLVDARPVKQALASARRADLVVVLSEELHASVVKGRYPSIDPAAHLPADLVTKHGEPRRGWVTVPGYAAPPGLTADAEGPAAPDPPAAEAPGIPADNTGDAAGGRDGAGPVPLAAPVVHEVSGGQVTITAWICHAVATESVAGAPAASARPFSRSARPGTPLCSGRAAPVVPVTGPPSPRIARPLLPDCVRVGTQGQTDTAKPRSAEAGGHACGSDGDERLLGRASRPVRT